jgi:Putative Actinobacterial Holin-X, holin superfamily III
MADANEGDRERRVASGFPYPDDVPGPTERLRELHPDVETAPKPPKFGRASASTAASDDYISMDDMLNASGSTLAGGAADKLAAFARRIGDETADRLRAELDRRGIADQARAAGFGVGQMGIAGALGLGALGAGATAMIAGMSRVMPVWASALVTAGVLGVPAGILAADGLRRLNASVGAAMGVPAQP